MPLPLPVPLALTSCLPTELLTFVLRQIPPTTVIICSTRNAFLFALLKGTYQPDPQPEGDRTAMEGSRQPALPSVVPSIAEDDDPGSPELPPKHPLLIPTLQQISCSRHVNL